MGQEDSSIRISRRAVIGGASAALGLSATEALARPWSARAATTSDFDLLRTQWRTTLTTDFDTDDTTLAKYAQAQASSAAQFWRGDTPLNTASDRTYLWADQASPTMSATVTTTATRLRQLALALNTPGSTLSSNADLKSDLVSAFSWYLANMYDGKADFDNWWDWQIGAPQALNDFVVLMYDDLPASDVATAMDHVKHYLPDPTKTGGATSTGANRNWACAITMVRGALSKDQPTIDTARKSLDVIFSYSSSGDGIYRDGGFVQHVHYAYTAGYGLSMLQVLTTIMVSAQQTPWDFSQSQVAEVFDWTQDNFTPWIYGGGVMDMNHGRGISRFYETDRRLGRLALGVLLQLVQVFPQAGASQLRSQLKGWLTAYNSYTRKGSTPGEEQADWFTYDPVPIQQVTLPSVVLGRQLMSDRRTPTGAESTRTVVSTSMARAVHRRPGFAMGFAMETSAIYPYECANGENRMGWYQGEGAVYLFLPNHLGHWADEWWPTANKCRIPGTTVVKKTPEIGKGVRSTVTNTWAGGALLDGRAALGMGLSFKTQPLRARKSWFCIDDAVVCLGAGITSTDGNGIETIIEQRSTGAQGTTVPIVDGRTFSTIGSEPTQFTPRWAYLPDTSGYLFPQAGTRVQAIREDRTGHWTDMDNRGGYDDKTTYSRRFVTMWFDHGVDPTDAEYAYIQLPGASQSAVAAAAADMAGVEIVANTADVQAVTRRGKGLGFVTMANFWSGSAAPTGVGVQASQPCSVVLTLEGDLLSIAVSDPTQRLTEAVELAVDGRVLRRDPRRPGDPEVTVVDTEPKLRISVPVAGTAGRSLVARFRVAPGVFGMH